MNFSSSGSYLYFSTTFPRFRFPENLYQKGENEIPSSLDHPDSDSIPGDKLRICSISLEFAPYYFDIDLDLITEWK